MVVRENPPNEVGQIPNYRAVSEYRWLGAVSQPNSWGRSIVRFEAYSACVRIFANETKIPTQAKNASVGHPPT